MNIYEYEYVPSSSMFFLNVDAIVLVQNFLDRWFTQSCELHCDTEMKNNKEHLYIYGEGENLSA